MKTVRMVIILAIVGVIAFYYSTTLNTHKQSIEYYGGK